MEKINIAELLRNCPKDMELNCTMYDNLYFNQIYDDDGGCIYEIGCYTIVDEIRTAVNFTKFGTFNTHANSKCVIFPKGKTTWEGFQKPFKDGDILINGLEDGEYNPFIFKQTNGLGNAQCYCAINCFEELILNSDNWTPIKGCRLATEEEKERLFDAIKANGYKWNAETKTLEKLIEPKFKVGDRVRHKEKTKWVCTIARVADRYYVDGHPMCYTLPFGKQDEYELVPDKFHITTLKPFDKVLVRDDDDESWEICLFGHCDESEFYQYKCINGCVYAQCIPYEGNEHLLGTTNDCDVLYKKWQL